MESRGSAERAQFTAQLDEFEDALEHLRVSYEKYFVGVDRVAPVRELERVRRQARDLERMTTRSTALRFRLAGLRARFVTYQHYWTRVEREIERGVSRRDLLKLRHAAPAPAPPRSSTTAPLHLTDDAEIEAALDALAADAAASLHPDVREGTQGASFSDAPGPRGVESEPSRASAELGAPVVAGGGHEPSRPRTSPPPPPPQAAPPTGSLPPRGLPRPVTPPPPPPLPGVDPAHLRQVFKDFVRAKQAVGEDVKGLTYAAMCRRLAIEAPKLLERHKCERVRFEVSTVDGRVRLLARPA